MTLRRGRRCTGQVCTHSTVPDATRRLVSSAAAGEVPVVCAHSREVGRTTICDVGRTTERDAAGIGGMWRDTAGYGGSGGTRRHMAPSIARRPRNKLSGPTSPRFVVELGRVCPTLPPAGGRRPDEMPASTRSPGRGHSLRDVHNIQSPAAKIPSIHNHAVGGRHGGSPR